MVLSDALAALGKQGEQAGGLLQELERRVAGGEPLATAMAGHSDRFTAEEIALVEAGEASGRLDQALDKLAGLHEQNRSARRQLWSQAAYPLLLLHLAAAALPFARLSLAQRLTLSAWLIRFLLILAPVYAGYFLLLRLRRRAGGRERLRKLVERLPGFGNAARHRRRAIFAGVMEAAYGAGIPMDRCILLAGSAAELRVTSAAKQVAEGNELSLSLGSARVLPAGALARLATGEQAGELSAALQAIAREETEEASAIFERSLKLSGKALELFVALWIAYEVIRFYAKLYSF